MHIQCSITVYTGSNTYYIYIYIPYHPVILYTQYIIMLQCYYKQPLVASIVHLYISIYIYIYIHIYILLACMYASEHKDFTFYILYVCMHNAGWSLVHVNEFSLAMNI